MASRLDDVPVYEVREINVEADLYNLVQIAHKRLQCPIRFSLPKLRTLDLILDKNEWVVVDRALNDVPVMAWTAFDSKGRSSLHQPINCELRLYHAYAPLIRSKVLQALIAELQQGLAALQPEDEQKVVNIKGKH